MALFQKTVIKKHLLDANSTEVDAAYQRFSAYFHDSVRQQNIRNSKEEQFQEGFLRELFGHIFGYTLNPEPNFNLTTELKNTSNSKKVDGAIVFDGKAIAVIELKGTNTTDLNSIETQAFGYKNNQSECVYVITSNFEKLRFYIDNSIDFEEFNLFTLSREQFNLLYLCLSLPSIQQNLPKRLKDESVSQEDAITKKLYKDYSEFKRALYHNLVELNPEFDKLMLFKKTQKLLDRFLFIFFAEDRLLLPTNLIFRINLEWKNLMKMRMTVSLYERYKVYFNDLNVGAKVTLPAFGKKTGDAIEAEFEIFAYNGGLFVPDEVLDNVKIDDEVLHVYTEKMSHYDFDSDVDVNILGHIFENSLNEIDEIKSEIEGETVDKTKTRRKKDGVFYTPKYITKYIVDNTVGKLCSEKKAELKLADEDYTNDKKIQTKTKKAHLDKLTDYRAWLLQLTICDPACGSGAFLNQALEFLIAEHRYVDELQAKLMGDSMILSDVETSILENNIYGVDLNDESVEIAKLSLWLRTAQKGRKLNSLNNNIKCGNSLIDDPEVAGDKAFSWEKEFPEVFARGGFDVVIGNPPYLNMTKVNTGLLLEFYIEKYQSVKKANSKNIYTIFNEKSCSIVKDNGLVSFIIPEGFLKTRSYDDCVKTMSFHGQIYKAIYFEEWVFEDATTGSMIFEFIKNKFVKVSFENFLMKKNRELVKLDDNTNSIIKKYNSLKFPALSELAELFKGMAVQNRENFIFRERENLPNKFLLGNCIERYSFKNQFYCDYKELTIVGGTKKIEKHNIFPRILIRRTGNFLCCVLLEEQALTESTLYSCSIKDDSIDINYLISVLNSKFLTYIVRQNMITNEQAFPQIMMNDIQLLKIPKAKLDIQNKLSEKSKLIFNQINGFHLFVQKLSTYICSQYNLEKLSGKLSSWYELDFSDFIKELNKAIKAVKGTPLSRKDEFEWMELFEENKQKALALKAEIDRTDKEIDQMVYELYGLTEEEIKIVEGN